jgi:hypothetical protein
VKLSKVIVSGLVAGATLVGTAWAGVGLVPIGGVQPPAHTGVSSEGDVTDGTVEQGVDPSIDPAGGALVGVAKRSMYPRPEDYDGYWERDTTKCDNEDQAFVERIASNTNEEIDHLAVAGSPWPENPSCIYVGGFGIGPENSVGEFDRETDPAPGGYGLWVRSIAIGDGADTLVLTVIDAEGYLWDYASKCARCGSKQLGEDLGKELNLPASSFVIAATHSHSAPDFLGGWGFVPDWYMTQITDTIKETVKAAVADMRPATIEVGEQLARRQNHERRDTYRSAEEQQLGWLRAIDATTGNVIATMGAYAAHPTANGDGNGKATSDWVGHFEKAVEAQYPGSIGLHFMTGLGNMSNDGGVAIGEQLAALIPPVGGGTVLTDTDLRVAQTTWKQPATNVPLTALGFPGFFDRKFLTEPSTIQTGKSPDTAPCASASAFTVELPATAARIGDQFALTTAPGEVFANATNTIKDNSRARFTMPLAQANDALGYMPQNFEISPIGQQGLGFVAGGVLIVNYEDSYAIDHCTGDKVIETQLEMLDNL